jgi:hypothetical protein
MPLTPAVASEILVESAAELNLNHCSGIPEDENLAIPGSRSGYPKVRTDESGNGILQWYLSSDCNAHWKVPAKSTQREQAR